MLSAALIAGMFLATPAVQPAYAADVTGPVFAYPKDVLGKKAHGTCPVEVEKDLRFGTDVTTADVVSCFNKNLAEVPGYAFQADKKLVSSIKDSPTKSL